MTGLGKPTREINRIGSPSLPGKRDVPRRVAVGVFTAALFVVPVMAYFWFVHQYSVNTIWYDQWWDVNLLSHLYSGSLNLGDLWTQHGGNPILVPNLIVLLLAPTTHLNVVTESYLSASLLVLSIALMVLAHRRRVPSTPWIWYWPVTVLLLSFVQFQDSLWGFQLAWYIVLVSLAGTIWLLDHPTLSWPLLIAAMVVALIGSFSSLQGLLIWPTALVLLYQRRRPRAMIGSWIVAAAVTTVVYFVDLDTQTAGGSSNYAFAHPLDEIQYFFLAISGVFGNHITAEPSLMNHVLVAVGVFVLAVALGLAFVFGRRQVNGGSPIGVSLVLYGLLFAVTMTVGRAGNGLAVAGTSRYTTFDLLIPAGCYFALLDPIRCHRRIGWRRGTATGSTAGRLIGPLLLVTAAGVLVVVGSWSGLRQAKKWHQYQTVAADITVRIDHAPTGLVDDWLFPGCECPSFTSTVPELTVVARTHHLSLFGAGQVDAFLRQGLPRDTIAPITAMVMPTTRSVLRGDMLIGARASDNYGVTKVEFQLTGSNFTDVVIATGVPFVYGWLGGWNTRNDPMACIPYGAWLSTPPAILAEVCPLLYGSKTNASWA